MGENVVEVSGLKKFFPGTKAVDFEFDDSISFRAGEIHAIVGENGAGKSTMAHIVAGIHQRDGGSMTLEGRPYSPTSIRDAEHDGIGIILQEPGLVPTITVAENMLIGREREYTTFGVTRIKLRNRFAKGAMEGIVNVSPDSLAGRLNYEDQKLVELARALSFKPRLVLLDETTGALSLERRRTLFATIKRLAATGVCVVLVSHELDEVIEHSTRVSVLKDGKLVETLDNIGLKKEQLSTLMVGRDVKETSHRINVAAVPGAQETPLLAVRELTVESRLFGLSFEVRAGSVVGFGGIAGCGSNDLGRAIFGDLKITEGEVSVNGRTVAIGAPTDAIGFGIAYVPKNRDSEGLILNLNVRQNIVLPLLHSLARAAFVRKRDEKSIAGKMIDSLQIRASSTEDSCRSLSGGNRQKVVLGKWLAKEADVYVLDNPTRGVDIGAKEEIYRVIEELTQEGKGIVLISDELPELLRICDHLVVLRNGYVSRVFDRREEWPEERQVIEHMI